ncbi:SCO family protein [Natronospira bacteriovora]|uniref:SCO family protein n=1 Tax=Natronospira bacteriovora TaxID=3069753 RepID=A0ABU0W4K7_9GAMM|nr:SCO family protein [Natronospira sp. AB-CW4]MDQ2068916.1 SCO family protein [Natronospira sp. AB-CW4]
MHRSLILLIALVFAAAGAFVAHLITDRPGQKPETEAVLLDQPRLIPDMILLDHYGTAWSPGRLQGQWSLIFYGFTHCPDICPETMVQMNQVHRLVEESGQVMPPSVIFVSVDPARDTPERLAQYVPYFNRNFLGLTGSEDAVVELALSMGVPVAIPEVEPGEDYEVDHGASLTLVDPDGHIRAFFTPPHRVESIARDYEAIVRYLNSHH